MALDESVEEFAPNLVVFLAEEVFLCCAEGHDEFFDFEGQLVDALGVSRD